MGSDTAASSSERLEPLGDSPAWQLSVEDRSQPAGRAFALLLESALSEQREREQLVRTEGSPRDLHRYRITLRRTRSLLAAGRRVFPAEELELLEALVAAHAAVTAPCRDLDVLLGDLDDLTDDLVPSLHGGVEDLRSALVRMRVDSGEELAAALDDASHEAMLRRWAKLGSVYLVGTSEPGPWAPRPMGEVADEMLWKAWRRVRKQGAVATRSRDPQEWHTLRKRAKRFRYLLEWFDPLYPPKALKPVRKRLRSLQEAFGSLQDEVVRVELFHRAGELASPAGAMTAGALVQRESSGLADAVRRCHDEWESFDTAELRDIVSGVIRR